MSGLADYPDLRVAKDKLDKLLDDDQITGKAYRTLRDDLEKEASDRRKAPIDKPAFKRSGAPDQAKAAKTLPPAIFIAIVRKTVVDRGSTTPHLNEAAVARVKKCLESGKHPRASEIEAKRALYNAALLMKRHDISHAQVLAQQSPEERAKAGGHSIVAILRNDGKADGKVQQNVYVNDLCHAMNEFFGSKSYTTGYKSGKQIDITFYGVADNAIGAADAFAMVYNMIRNEVRDPKYHKARGKNSYGLGVSREVWERAKKENDEEEARVIQAQKKATSDSLREKEAQRKSELDRLAAHPVVDPRQSDIAPEAETSAQQEKDLRAPVFRQTLQRIACDVFVGGRADQAHVLQAINNHLLEIGFTATFDETEAQSLLQGLVEQGTLDENAGGQEIVLGTAVMQAWGCAPADVASDASNEQNQRIIDLNVDEDEEDDNLSDADFIMDDDESDACGNDLPFTPPTEQDEDDEEFVDPALIALKQEIRLEPTKVATHEDRANSPAKEAEPEYKSHMQLVLKREMFSDIADDYLKKMNIKLNKGRMRKIKNLDREAYAQGRVDGAKIDLRKRKLIKDSEKITAGAGMLIDSDDEDLDFDLDVDSEVSESDGEFDFDAGDEVEDPMTIN